MTYWLAKSPQEVADLAVRLRDLDWSWQLTDAPLVAEEFDWRVLSAKPGWVQLDTGFGETSGIMFATRGRVERIEVQVVDYAERTEKGRAQLRVESRGLARVLKEALGEPVARVSGETTQLRWAGTETTVVYARLPLSGWLWLVTNERLDSDDSIDEMVAQQLP